MKFYTGVGCEADHRGVRAGMKAMFGLTERTWKFLIRYLHVRKSFYRRDHVQ
ncbi:MAG: hypothetical protein WAO58_03565 [Fimbriimonadaceae bacterium]